MTKELHAHGRGVKVSDEVVGPGCDARPMAVADALVALDTALAHLVTVVDAGVSRTTTT